jgi:hypothetical protein
MPKDISFEVDVLDKKAIRERLPELQALLEQKRRELAELQERYDQLRRWAGFPVHRPSLTKGAPSSSSIDEVVTILERAQRPMRSREVVLEMGPSAKRETASWALWSAEAAGLIQRLERGLYAPRGWKSAEGGAGDED